MSIFVKKDDEIANITARMGLNMPNSADIIQRSDFPAGPAGDDAYCEACARRDLAMRQNPELLDLKRKYAIQLEAEREKERREAQQKAYEDARAAARLTAQESKDLSARALELANQDLRAGRIKPQEFDETRQKHFDRLESKQLDNKASGAVFNAWARQELNRNRYSSDPARQAAADNEASIMI